MNRERPKGFRHFSDVRSTASDPAERTSNAAFPVAQDSYNDGISRRDHAIEIKDNTDADGDDELVTNDEDEEDIGTNRGGARPDRQTAVEDEDYFTTPVATRFGNIASTPLEPATTQQPKTPSSPRPGPSRRSMMHNRTLSTNTILYAPEDSRRPRSSSSTSSELPTHPRSRPLSNRNTPVDTPNAGGGGGGRRSPRRSVYMARPRAILPPREFARTAANRPLLQALDIPTRLSGVPRRSSPGDLDTSSEPTAATQMEDRLGTVPANFAAQMAMAMAPIAPIAQSKGAGGVDRDSTRMSRLVLFKMKTLEDSLNDVVREMRALRNTAPSTGHNSGDDNGWKGHPGRMGSGSSGGQPMIEVAGREREGVRRSRLTPAKFPERRPGSRLGLNDDRPGLESEEANEKDKGKGKGKAVRRSDVDDSDEKGNDSEGFDDEQSSFMKKGSSL